MKKIFTIFAAICCAMTTMAAVPTGAINGKFTINANGDQVYFSQGNLQYQASTNTWRFAEHQYDRISDGKDVYSCNVKEGDSICSNLKASSTYDGWIDLFAWATSGYSEGTAINYQPWSITEEMTLKYDQELNAFGYGPDWADITGEYAEYDWGVHNAISNGGNTANQWRTLTKDEWHYLIYERPNADSLRSYALITNTTQYYLDSDGKVKEAYGSIPGIILLPDDHFWNHMTNPFLAQAEQQDSVSKYDAEFFNDLQGAGRQNAIFLPFAGLRQDSTTIYDKRWAGFYWTASGLFNEDSYYVGLNSGKTTVYVDDNTTMSRNMGLSVRLVQNARKEVDACQFTSSTGDLAKLFAVGDTWNETAAIAVRNAMTPADGAPYYWNSNNSNLYKWDATENQWVRVERNGEGTVLAAGRYYFDIQIRIDGTNGNSYKFIDDIESVSITVDGKTWANDGGYVATLPDTYSYFNATSPEFELKEIINEVNLTIEFPEIRDELPHSPITPSSEKFNVIGSILPPPGAGYEITQYFFETPEGNWPEEDTFQPGTTYKLVALVEPLAGYTFPLNGTLPDFEQMNIYFNGEKVTDFSGFGKGDGIFSFSMLFTTDLDTQGVENVQGDMVQSTKVLRDGILYIERNGRTYNACGQEVK